MKTLCTLIFVALCATAGAQTLRSLMVNTNGQVVSATNVTFTNGVNFSTNARAATRANLDLAWPALTNSNSASALIGYNTNNNTVAQPTTLAPFDFGEVGLRANNAEFGGVSGSVGFATNGKITFYTTNSGFDFSAGASGLQLRRDIGIPLAALTNTSNVTMMRALAGSTNTNQPFSGTFQFKDQNDDVFVATVSNGIILSVQEP